MNEIDWDNGYLNLDRLSIESAAKFFDALFHIIYDEVYKNGT